MPVPLTVCGWCRNVLSVTSTVPPPPSDAVNRENTPLAPLGLYFHKYWHLIVAVQPYGALVWSRICSLIVCMERQQGLFRLRDAYKGGRTMEVIVR